MITVHEIGERYLGVRDGNRWVGLFCRCAIEKGLWLEIPLKLLDIARYVRGARHHEWRRLNL